MKTKQTKSKYTNFRLTPGWQLFVAASIFAAAVFMSRHAEMLDWEVDLFLLIYEMPEIIRPVMFAATQFGSIQVFGVLLFVLAIKRRYDIVVNLLLAGSLAYLMSGIAKDLWGRMRPHEFLTDVINLDYQVRGPGFPSGHTALAVAMALTLRTYMPKQYQWVAVVWIVAVAFSRMYLGIHAPLDIVGGLAIGWAAHALVRQVKIQTRIPLPKVSGSKGSKSRKNR